MRLFIDIETAPSSDPGVIGEIESGVTAPANYTKPESIQQWLETKGQAAKREAVGKTALDGGLGSIIAIGIATDDHDPVVLTRDPDSENDSDLLRVFFDHVEELLNDATPISPTDGERLFKPEPYFAGHNISFDLGFIWRRCVINNLVPPFDLPSPDQMRHGKNAFCTMQAWAGFGQRISLSRLSRALGLPDPKQNEEGISGANAWEFWRQGDLDTVVRYCSADVMAARSIFHRMEAMTSRRAA